MNVTDLIIIYFACGSPFCVYYFTSLRVDLSPKSIIMLLLKFLVWPIPAIELLRIKLLSANPTPDALLDNAIDNIRTELEKIAYSGTAASSIFNFREIFSRFSGLTRQLKIDRPSDPTTEIFGISGHKDSVLAAACLERRNRERLVFHQLQARNDFVDLISDLANGDPGGDKIARLALGLAELLHDPESAEDLSVLLSGPGRGSSSKNVGDLEKDIWNPKARTASAVN